MKVCGVICEYNPFHNGHAHQLSRAKKLTNADFLVCAMSGAFVQRGEPACLDKWTRAEAALRGGADLVLELPALFAVRAAQDFAFGGVSLLDALGVVTHLSFGAENDDLALLTRLSRPETAEESERIRQGLAQGLSHPAARAAALGVPTPPNVILAAEYLRALQKLGSRILPVPVKRDSEHRDETLHSMASATAIRAVLREGLDVSCAMPQEVRALQLGALPSPLPDLDGFSQTLLYILRTTPPDVLRDAYAIPEGLENRLCREAFEAGSAAELLTRIACRRYSPARIRRLLVQMLLHLDAETIRSHPQPEYARALGFRKSAAPLLRAISEKSRLPLIVKAADAPHNAMLRLDFAAQDVWDLLSGRPAHRDLTERLRILP